MSENLKNYIDNDLLLQYNNKCQQGQPPNDKKFFKKRKYLIMKKIADIKSITIYGVEPTQAVFVRNAETNRYVGVRVSCEYITESGEKKLGEIMYNTTSEYKELCKLLEETGKYDIKKEFYSSEMMKIIKKWECLPQHRLGIWEYVLNLVTDIEEGYSWIDFETGIFTDEEFENYSFINPVCGFLQIEGNYIADVKYK